MEYRNTTNTHLHIAEHVVIPPKTTIELSEDDIRNAMVKKLLNMGWLIQSDSPMNVTVVPEDIASVADVIIKPKKQWEGSSTKKKKPKGPYNKHPAFKNETPLRDEERAKNPMAPHLLQAAIDRASEEKRLKELLAEVEKNKRPEWNPLDRAAPVSPEELAEEEASKHQHVKVRKGEYGNIEHDSPFKGIVVRGEDGGFGAPTGLSYDYPDPKNTKQKGE